MTCSGTVANSTVTFSTVTYSTCQSSTVHESAVHKNTRGAPEGYPTGVPVGQGAPRGSYLYGRVSPRASMAQAMVLAVYIPPQAPWPGHELRTICCRSSSVMAPATYWP